MPSGCGRSGGSGCWRKGAPPGWTTPPASTWFASRTTTLAANARPNSLQTFPARCPSYAPPWCCRRCGWLCAVGCCCCCCCLCAPNFSLRSRHTLALYHARVAARVDAGSAGNRDPPSRGHHTHSLPADAQVVGNVNACVDGVNFLLLYLSFLLEPVLTALIAVSACTPPRRSYAFAFFLQDGFHKRMFEVRVSWRAHWLVAIYWLEDDMAGAALPRLALPLPLLTPHPASHTDVCPFSTDKSCLKRTWRTWPRSLRRHRFPTTPTSTYAYTPLSLDRFVLPTACARPSYFSHTLLPSSLLSHHSTPPPFFLPFSNGRFEQTLRFSYQIYACRNRLSRLVRGALINQKKVQNFSTNAALVARLAQHYV